LCCETKSQASPVAWVGNGSLLSTVLSGLQAGSRSATRTTTAGTKPPPFLEMISASEQREVVAIRSDHVGVQELRRDLTFDG
jgi:hypothetical protein